MLTASMLDRRWPRAPHSLVDGIAATAAATLEKYQITTPLRLAHFLAQVSEETGGGTRLEENLHYSAERAHAVWPSRFPTAAAAMPYAGNPRLLADAVYDGRMGNRPGTDDGWTYRGRGLIQLTGHDLYADIGAICGLDLANHPELASDPNHCLDVAGAYWHRAGVNAYADRDDLRAETERINGGLTNLAARQAWLAVWKQELPAASPAEEAATSGPEVPDAPTKQGGSLAVGASGNAVLRLQRDLNRQSAGRKLPEDGRFGARTKAAVAAFQRRHGLRADGVAGRETLGLLETTLALPE